MEDDWHDLDLSGLRLSARAQKDANHTKSNMSGKQDLTRPLQVQNVYETSNNRQVSRNKRIPAQDIELKTPPRQYGLHLTRGDNGHAVKTSQTSPSPASRKRDSPQIELQRRLRQGLQPRRHVPSPSRVDAIAAWQHKTQLEEENDFAGIEIPDSSRLSLHRPKKSNIALPEFESDNEDWGEGSLGIRHASKTSRSNRQSTSSILSSSNLSTDESQAGLDGLELPDNMADLKRRFYQNTERRAAGNTIRHARKPVKMEDHADGLVVEHDSFAKNLRFGSTIRGPRSNLPMPSRSYSSRNLANREHTGQLENMRTAQDRHASSNRPAAITQRVDTRPNVLQSRNQVNKPAFLPSGTAGVSSHHINVRVQRNERNADTVGNLTSPSKRRATASEALRMEAARCNARAHVRAKTYGEGHELDNLDDLPLDSTPSSRGPSVTSSPYSQAEKLQRYQEKRRTTPSNTIRSSQTQARRLPLSKINTKADTSTSVARPDRSRRKNVTLPGLISGINAAPTVRKEKNMAYNPKTFRWEGNEQEMNHFDTVMHSPPRPALIAHVSSTVKAVQVSNGMVFDPEQMCWVKLSDEDSEVDPFDALDDLEDERPNTATSSSKFGKSTTTNVDQFSIGEEFDVGRQFIRKQREEEVRWRNQAKGWFKGRRPGMSRQYLQEIYVLLTEDE